MNRNHLALFCAVAEAGSISGGAAKLRISQPAVSKQIAELEDALGVRLLDRLPRGSRLTDAGTVLAEHGRRWLSAEVEAERAIAELRGLRRGRLSVGASLTIGAYLLPRVMARFRHLYPAIEFNLQIANTEQIQRELLAGSIDVGLTEGPLDSAELESSVFRRDELIVVAPADHPLAARKRVAPRDLAGEPFIFREAGSGTRAVVERALLAKGLVIRPLLSLASPEAIKNAVAVGLGLAVVSRMTIELELKNGILVQLACPELKISRPFHLQRVKGRSASPSLANLLPLIVEAG